MKLITTAILLMTLLFPKDVMQENIIENPPTIWEQLEKLEEGHTHIDRPEWESDYAGRLYMIEGDIDVAVYYASYTDGKRNREVCDAKDSAVWLTGRANVIGDHVNQGFSGTKLAVEGETQLYLLTGDTLYIYRCSRIDKKGKNISTTLVWSDGTDAMSDTSADKIITYTCNDTWRSVTLVEWELIGEETKE